MSRAGTQLSTWLDLAALSNVAAEPPDVLVVNVLDVVDTKGTDLAPWSVATAPWTSSAAAGPSTTAFGLTSLTTLTLRATEAGSPRATGAARAARATASAVTSWTRWAAEAGTLRAAVSAACTIVTLV